MALVEGGGIAGIFVFEILLDWGCHFLLDLSIDRFSLLSVGIWLQAGVEDALWLFHVQRKPVKLAI